MTFGTPQSADAREPIHTRVWDAITWTITAVIYNVRALPDLWQRASRRDRAALVVTAGWLVTTAQMVIFLHLPWLFWLIPAGFVIQLLGDVSDIADRLAERDQLHRLLQQQPTGAPRVANVVCSNGCSHRFLYGLGGWEEAGPAESVSTLPALED